MMSPRLLFFTKYTQKGPSSRFRTYQYLDKFKDDYICLVFPFFDDEYIVRLYSGRKVSFIKILYYYLRRTWNLLENAKKNDIIFIEYELMPYFFAWFEAYLKLRSIKFIVDYDDAIFHNYDKSNHWLIRFLFRNKIPKVIQYASHVITGSPYLTDFASKYNKKVSEIPTSIIYQKYEPVVSSVFNKNFVIGWIGSKSTSINLLLIKEALTEFRRNHPDVVIQLVGVEKRIADELDIIPTEWTEENELRLLNSFNVGIMPLIDNDFNKGKCGFKLIQYMACGKPTVSTPLEANIKINRNKKNLYANTNQEWIHALEQIYNNRTYFAEVGEENKKDVINYYSVEANAPIYKSIFRKLFTHVG